MEGAHAAPPLEETSLSTPRISVSPWIVLIVLALGEFMILLDTTIVSVAVPSLSTDLSASLDQILWVLNAYTLTFAVLLITSGRLGDMVGPKKMFLAGLTIFTLSSLLCGLAQTPLQLIIFRVTQGVGAATLMPQTLSVITSIFPAEKRGAAFGAWSAVAGAAAVAGPTLGGALTSGFSWRAVFFPNVPLGIAAIVLASLFMPDVTVHRRRRIDFVGIVLSTTGLVALIFALIEGQKYSWGRIKDLAPLNVGPIRAGLISIPSLFLLSVLLLAIFVFWEARQDEPLLPLSLFRNRNYSIGCFVAASVNFAILGFFFPLTLFLQSVLGLTAVEAGVAVIPNAVLVVAVAPISGRMTDKVNGKYVLFIGLLLFAGGLYLLGRFASLTASGASFALPLAIVGLGMGLTFAPMTSMAMRSIVPSAAGAASGFLNTIRQVGAAVGSAVVGAVLADQLAVEMKSQAKHFALQLPAQFRASFINGVSKFSTGGLEVGVGQTRLPLPSSVPRSVAHQMQALGQTVYNHAFLNAMLPSLYVAIPFLLVAAIAALFMTGRRAEVPAVAPVEVEAVPPVPVAEPAFTPAPMPISTPLGVSGTVLMPVAVPRRRAPSGIPPIRLPYVTRVGTSGADVTLGGRPVTIGRLGSNDIQLDNPKVSRQHAQFMALDGTVVVRDLNSINGTYVNGQKVEREKPIHDGDVIAIGDDALIFHSDIERVRPRLVPSGKVSEEILIDRPLSIGRLSTNDIVVKDPRVSRRHAELRFEDGDLVLRDLETLNGSYVNGQPVQGDAVIVPGDLISVGPSAFVYRNDAKPVKSTA